MGFELPNGKTARNIQEQVKFLTEKIKELIARVNELELHIEIVDELPETGSSDVIYFVPVEDPEEGNYYNEYMWIDDSWELIGTTQIDLSGYVDLASTQTITGLKTFTNKIKLRNDEYTYIDGTNGTLNFSSINGEAKFGVYVLPSATNALDLGAASYAWKDLYLSGKISFTSDAYIDYSSSAIHIHNLYNTITVNEGGTVLGDTCQAKDIQPISNNTYDLGASSLAWKDLYLSGNAYLGNSSELRIEATASDKYFYLKHNANVFHIGAVGVATNLVLDSYLIKFVPQGNNSQDLGSSTYAWKDIYLSGNLSDGTNSVSVAAISKTRLYRHRFQFTYTGGGGYLNVITNSATAISDTESDFQTAIDSAISVYVNQSDGSRALFLSASLSQNNCRWFTSSGTATGGSVSFGSESIAEIQ